MSQESDDSIGEFVIDEGSDISEQSKFKSTQAHLKSSSYIADADAIGRLARFEIEFG